jgi:hypothetical protein
VAFAFALTLSMSRATSSSTTLQSIPMGQAEIEGGTTQLGEIDPAAIRTNGTTSAEGQVRNASSLRIAALDFSLKNADTSAGTTKLAVEGLDEVAFDALGVAHVEFSSGSELGGTAVRSYVVSALKADPSGPNVVFSITPSPRRAPPGNTISCNILPAYNLDSMSDLARNGIAEMYRSAALAIVNNVDADARITAVTGAAYLLDVKEKLTSIQFLLPNGQLVPRAHVELDGDKFTVTGFSPIDPGQTVHVVMIFAGPIGGTRMRAQIQALFGG